MTGAVILPSAAERKLARELAEMRSAIDTLRASQRATQLEHSTLYGNLTARDADGGIRAIIGVQGDGTWAIVNQGGPPPDRPATPVCTPSMNGIIVTWNGQLVSGRPADLMLVNVYVSRLGESFPCDDTTFVGTLQHAGDLPVAPLDPGVTYWVKFRAASTTVQNDGTPLLGVESFATSCVPGQVVAAAVIAGIIDDLALAAEAVTEAKLAAAAVTGTKIAPDSIASPHIVAQAIQALHVAADAIQAGSVAADVITGRELRALSILAEHINVNSIDAGHLQAGIIDASKLTAMLVLATRIILGDPVGARLEIDETGLDQYDESGARTLQFGSDPAGGNFLTIMDPASPQTALASIADNGVMTAQSFRIAGSLGYQGSELGELFEALPKGLITWGTRNIGEYTTDSIGIMELEVLGQAGRTYRIMHSSCYVEGASGVTGDFQGEMSLHYTLDGSRPTVASPTLTTTGRSAPRFGGGLMASFGQVMVGDAPARIRVLLTYQSHFGLSTRFTTAGFDNGLLFWIEDVGKAIPLGGVSSSGGGTGTAASATYTREWVSTWARCWTNGGTAVRYTDAEMVQGYINDGVNGDHVSAFGFDTATIRSSLTAATIDKVELYLYAHHWYWNSGGQARVRTHNVDATDVYPAVSATIATPTLGKPEGRWVVLPKTVGDGFKSGTVRGFALDARDIARNLTHYGRFDGIGWGSPPRLRITFRAAGTGGGTSGGTVDSGIPAPTGLTAVWNANSTVTLNWTATPSTDSTEVHEFLVDPTDTLKGTMPFPTGTRTSTTLTPGSTYLYAVRARRGTSVSAFTQAIRISNTAQSTEAAPGGGTGGSGLAAPASFSATMDASRVVTTSWTVSPGSDGTEVHEFLVDSSQTLKATVPVPGTSRQSGVLAGGREYLYAARAVKGGVPSDFSNAVRIRADGTSVADAAGGASGGSGGGSNVYTRPGDLFKFDFWELTLPVGTSGNPVDIFAGGSPDLQTYVNPDYFRLAQDSGGAYYTEFVSPVNGPNTATTSADSGATRSELREMGSARGGENGVKAAWSPSDGKQHEMTATITVNPSGIVNGRKEGIIGQIHGVTGSPPIYLSANFNSGGKITLFKDGPAVADILTGITTTTKFSYRLLKTTGNRLRLYYALGEVSALPSTPQYDWAASEFSDNSGWYFKIGAYNKTALSDPDASGSLITRMYYLTLDGVGGPVAPTGGGTTGGGTGGGTSTSLPAHPGQAMHIGTADGQNHYNVGIAMSTSSHVDTSASDIAGGFTNSKYKLSADKLWVIHDVQIDGATTSSGTKYARCEERELAENGVDKAAWNGASGTHRHKHISKVMHVPPNKPSVCFTQIHDASSDLCRVQTESNGSGGYKIVMRNTPPGSSTETVRTLISNYNMGDTLDCSWSVVNGNGTFTLNGSSYTFPASTSGCYFKYGAYAQTNETIDSATEHCEVWVKAGTVETWHTGYPTPTKAAWAA